MGKDEVSVLRVGSSLSVPNVQELAANSRGISEIPPRYIRPEVDTDEVISVELVELPIIDLSRLLDPEFFQEESGKLAKACEEWGFFQLINHGISEEVMNKMKADTREFFKLPLKEKEAYAQLPDSVEGYGQAFVVSEEQKLDWADMISFVTRPTSSRNMRFWPTNPPTFRNTLKKYSSAVKDVAERLFGLMAKSLGLDPETFLINFKDQSQVVRINYYPPCSKANSVLGLSPHTDANGLTLLLQVSDIQGLQIMKDRKWLPIEVLPGALVANIGDILEIMSNGRFKSIEHRAMINSETERISIAAFHMPINGVILGPLSEFVKQGEKKYRSTTYEDYLKAYFSTKLDGRSLLENFKIGK